jgi:hypothetical protein
VKTQTFSVLRFISLGFLLVSIILVDAVGHFSRVLSLLPASLMSGVPVGGWTVRAPLNA